MCIRDSSTSDHLDHDDDSSRRSSQLFQDAPSSPGSVPDEPSSPVSVHDRPSSPISIHTRHSSPVSVHSPLTPQQVGSVGTPAVPQHFISPSESIGRRGRDMTPVSAQQQQPVQSSMPAPSSKSNIRDTPVTTTQRSRYSLRPKNKTLFQN